MLTFLYALHFIVCFILIGVVLLQRGKGQDLGASLGGGGANTIFGSRGAGNFLTKITTASAIIFMGTSLSLSYLGYKSEDLRLFDESEPFVPAGATPKAEESGLEEVPGAAAAPGATDAAGATAGDTTGAAADAEPGLVEIPTDAAAPAAAGEAAGAPSSATSPAEATSAAPSPAAAAEPAKAPAAAAAPSEPNGANAAPAADAKQP